MSDPEIRTAEGRFAKGHSGNPGGRSKAQREVTELAQQMSTRALQRLGEWAESGNAKASVAACIAILDRAFGKPAQVVVGDDELPAVRINVEQARERLLARLAQVEEQEP